MTIKDSSINILNTAFIVIALFTGCLLFTSTSKAEIPAQLIAYNCYSCHGKELSRLDLELPSSALQLKQALLAFKYDKKTATIMNRIAKGYTDNELESVANYLKGFE